MELKDTIEEMTSNNYKERFRAEYKQVEIRLAKLNDILIRCQNGMLDFKLESPLPLLWKQRQIMSEYRYILLERARAEGINLD